MQYNCIAFFAFMEKILTFRHPEDTHGATGSFSVRLPFDGQQLQIILKISRAGWLQHDPFPIMIGLCSIILLTDSRGKRAPDLFKPSSFLFAKDDQETDAVLPGIEAAKCFAAPPILIFIRPVLPAGIPYPFHFVSFLNGRA